MLPIYINGSLFIFNNEFLSWNLFKFTWGAIWLEQSSHFPVHLKWGGDLRE